LVLGELLPKDINDEFLDLGYDKVYHDMDGSIESADRRHFDTVVSVLHMHWINDLDSNKY